MYTRHTRYCTFCNVNIRFYLHRHLHTHTHTHIYIYIYKLFIHFSNFVFLFKFFYLQFQIVKADSKDFEKNFLAKKKENLKVEVAVKQAQDRHFYYMIR